MNSKRLSIRLNLDKLQHQKAYEILSALPSGRKSEYVINAIIKTYDTEETLNMVKQVLQENLNTAVLTSSSDNGGIDNVVTDYLKSL